MKKIFSILLIFLMTISTVSAWSDWTNITCSNGIAIKEFNSTINGDPVNRTEAETCGKLNCVNNIGCIDPRNTPGEFFLGMLLLFILSSFLFGYLSMKITVKKHFPIRILFLFISLVMIMTSALMSNSIADIYGHTEITSITIVTFWVLFVVFFIVLTYFLLEIIKWAIKTMNNKSKDIDADEEMDFV